MNWNKKAKKKPKYGKSPIQKALPAFMWSVKLREYNEKIKKAI